jgi:hypothetical protein
MKALDTPGTTTSHRGALGASTVVGLLGGALVGAGDRSAIVIVGLLGAAAGLVCLGALHLRLPTGAVVALGAATAALGGLLWSSFGHDDHLGLDSVIGTTILGAFLGCGYATVVLLLLEDDEEEA